MALKSNVPSSGTPPTQPSAVPQDTVLLELSMYTNYTWRGHTFHKGKAYRFSRDDAMRLLSERDCERPVWKMYQKPAPKVVHENTEIDATQIMSEAVDMSMGKAKIENKRIDIGTDDELKAEGILPPDDDEGGGNVTV